MAETVLPQSAKAQQSKRSFFELFGVLYIHISNFEKKTSDHFTDFKCYAI